MKLKPLFDKVVIREEELKETTASGIILTGNAKEKPVMATVIAVGPGGIVDGKEVKMEVKVGDKILYSKYAGTEFKLPDETVTILRQSDILAIVED
ncbi:MAG: co-chaperone GroES [Clostridia bacterium]|nr:co-chaperone GroES [Clostridia bacterium]